MKNISIWEDIKLIKEYPTLNENKNVDVLIIGGGITGISTLYNLKNSNLNIMLVEQNKIGRSVTSKSTGKLSYLQNDLIDKIRNSFNDHTASMYLKSQIESIKMIVNIINKENINCDLIKVPSYLYTNKEQEIDKIKSLESFLINNNINVSKASNNLIKSKYMIKVPNTYLIHPLKFIYGLLKNNKYPIYENTSIKKIDKKNSFYLCYTDNYIIKAKYVVIASHYPYFIIPYLFPLKCSLEKSYISASKYIDKPISLISYSNPFISIRNYQDNLIYLSNSHLVNNKVCDKDNFNELIKKVNDLNLKPNYLWSNIDIMTNDNLPYIGKINNHLLIGTGYNTWGLTNGFLAGKIISDIILNKNNEYIDIFNPKRININQIIGNIKNTGKTIDGYIKGIIHSDHKYICPHAKCYLIYNEIEHTFDCPCHGSRFNESGKCISGPSNQDIDI